MLIGNGISLGRNPCRFLGMNTASVTTTGNWTQTGARRNFWAGEGTVVAGASIADTAAFPNGYEPPGSWLLAPKGGGLSAYNSIEGTGTITASLTMGKALESALTGSGGISAAALSLIVQLAAALTGSGTISTATLQAISSLSAALSGSGSISAAALSLIVSLQADLTGSGTLTAALRGTASLEADITVTGTGLTTANVGQAVWAALAAVNNDPGTMGEKLNDAGAAGDPWSTVLPGSYTGSEAGALLDQIQSLMAELHKIHGLDISAPLTVTPTTRVAGTISQDITGDGTSTTTVTRV